MRLVLLASIAIVLPASACDDMVVGNASHPDRASQRYIETFAGPVKARFVALADASRCRQADNRYSYQMLLSKVSGAGQAILKRAAAQGAQEGRSAGLESADPNKDPGNCKTAIDRLRGADDKLLRLAERVPG